MGKLGDVDYGTETGGERVPARRVEDGGERLVGGTEWEHLPCPLELGVPHGRAALPTLAWSLGLFLGRKTIPGSLTLMESLPKITMLLWARPV